MGGGAGGCVGTGFGVGVGLGVGFSVGTFVGGAFVTVAASVTTCPLVGEAGGVCVVAPGPGNALTIKEPIHPQKASTATIETMYAQIGGFFFPDT